MDRTPVVSSNLASVAYDEDTQTLEVEFVNGGTYDYFDVPERVVQELMSASSHGEYFVRNVRGVYRYARV